MRDSKSSNFSHIEDIQIVARVLEGNTEAFSLLVQRHHERVYNAVYSLIGDLDEADDLAQEAFLKAFRALNRFRGQSLFSTWLHRIAVNCCLDHLKSRHRRSFVSLDEHRETWDAPRIWAGQPQNADMRVERRELQEILERALDDLSEEYRVTFVLREIEGLTYEEIAELLKCSIGTVKSRLFRGRTKLREILQVQYDNWIEA
ncbi:MAG: sigma-70 family RNA polymerase sigma factor [Gemmatimonadetes bacterium]|nr:sigma-70 family RNA polymerase sigma factor [Gemmatimonadota bacterium]MDE2722772.1 sigma-70 family RNA polymerase sigma factor [Gemmatimonadota bacterium]MYB59298.1 sigma-70 family RNA polymerase sigma factor [Gemmatimonadota bacterium]MYC16774.1 sigma-70 family RNA polymerase sigma factor [Gemmatimonadota bacterium]MYD62223.1 sigma-70 family RNA polymerase sigma factor [Gemmatimonadota bacterium]